MSTLIRDGAIVADDYLELADDAALPASGQVIVSLQRWTEQRDALLASGLHIGVKLPNTLDVATQAAELQQRPLLALEFPSFPDGRAYSQARLLRDRYQFAGEIRATGQAVVRDQLQSMARSGFNSFALRSDQDAKRCLAALQDFTIAYQPATDALPLVRRLRRG